MSSQLDQELRHMSASHLAQLSTIIDEAKAWKDLLNELAGPLNLTLESIHRIKRQQSCDKSPTLALLNHWSITGRRRPTIEDLIGHLRRCRLARAEDFVWREILQVKNPDLAQRQQVEQNNHHHHHHIVQPSQPKAIEAAQDDAGCDERLQIGDEFRFQDLSGVISEIAEPCPRYSFEEIYRSTGRFCHRAYDSSTDTGARVGDGRFSSVFLASTRQEGEEGRAPPGVTRTIAAKLLKCECNMKYLVNEINLARRISHENILELRGISLGRHAPDQPLQFICLIYPYMQNGSLLECLKRGLKCNAMRALSWRERVDIATRVARGIHYLHSFQGGVIIHRDIKTANILLDGDLSPKLGDFTLVRQLESQIPGETHHSQNVIGTSVYMPPEAFRGDISTKFDTFSFGIVLLELLTGLRPFNEEANEDLLTFICDKLADIEDDQQADDGSNREKSTQAERYEQFLLGLVDTRAGNWDSEITKSLFKLALKATESRKRDRPEARDILDVLEGLFISQ